ncbi:STAS domain-containing protein [Actinosynnema sp. NPDC050436]|uniref:STAS domain-containing protein n=1 Tax=Actinosynnema sp. NPDC050436 TaxID=3155659 RepID=UPI0033E10ED8
MHRCTDRVTPASVRAEGPVAFLRVLQQLRDGVVHVRVVGEVDLATAPTLDRCLHAARSHAPDPVVLDLTGVRFLGTPGLDVLAEHHHGCAARGSVLRVVAAHRPVLHPVRLSGLDRLLHLFPDLHRATTAPHTPGQPDA